MVSSCAKQIFPAYAQNVPAEMSEIPCSDAQGISALVLVSHGIFAVSKADFRALTKNSLHFPGYQGI